FTALWYDYLGRFGLRHGNEVMPWMVDNADAYVMTTLDSRSYFEDWSRRLLGNPAVRLAVVEVTDTPGPGRIALFRIVTQPLVRDTAEWHILERAAWEQETWLGGPPSVAYLAFRPVAFAA